MKFSKNFNFFVKVYKCEKWVEKVELGLFDVF